MSQAKRVRRHRDKPMNAAFMLLLITLFQFFTFVQTIFLFPQNSDLSKSLAADYGEFIGNLNVEILFVFTAYILIEWAYFFVFRVFMKKRTFELEFIAFSFRESDL